MSGYITIGTELDTKSFDAQIAEVEKKLEMLEKVADESNIPKQFRRSAEEARKLSAEIEQTRNKLIDLRKRKQEVDQASSGKMLDYFKSISQETDKTIKKVAKWALAVFGIRSAYNFVRQSVSVLSQYNEKLASDIEYIRFAIASTLEPVIEKIIQIVYKLLQYVNYLAQAWFGVNLFANANAKAMNKAVGSAKELKKQLAGFDEMNVLSDNTASAGGGGVAPSFDLTEDMGEPPEWLITVRDIGQWILDNWEDVVMQLLLIKLVIDVLTGNYLKALLDFIGYLFIALPKLWDAIKAVVENSVIIFGQTVSWIYTKVIKPIGEWFANLWDGIVNGVTTAVNWVKARFQSIVSFFSNLISKIVGLFKTIGTKVGDAVSGAFKAVVNGVLTAIEKILNFPIKSINSLLDIINKVPGVEISTLPTFRFPRLAKGGIVSMPGRGVPIGEAIAGEAGREAVLPLQNTQVLQEIADAIGSRITINAQMNNYMNGRLISRELQKVQNEERFAYNKE